MRASFVSGMWRQVSLGEIEWTERLGFAMLVFSQDGRQLLSISSYIVRDLPGAELWEQLLTPGIPLLVLMEPQGILRITHAAYSPDSRWIVMADVNRRIRLGM